MWRFRPQNFVDGNVLRALRIITMKKTYETRRAAEECENSKRADKYQAVIQLTKSTASVRQLALNMVFSKKATLFVPLVFN